MKDPVATAKQLVRTVVRLFYETEHIVVMDALCYHGALPMADLVLILEAGKSSKHVGKVVGKLKEAGLCAVYTQQVMREGATKLTSREFFYVDWRRAIDSCKYRIHKIDDSVKKNAKPTAEKAELRCARCKSQFTTMEVLNSVDPDPESEGSGFLCLRCGHPLDEIDPGTQGDDLADDTPAKFNKMFRPLLKLMEEIDEMTIPAVEGSDAVAARIELPRDKNIDPGTRHEVIETVNRQPTAVKGIDTGPEKISVQIGSSAEQNEKQREAEKARQERIAMQNQLPSWHTQSTVTKEPDGVATVKKEANGVQVPSIKTEQAETKSTTQNLDLVFAQIEAERRKKEEEEDDDDDEEDDDEFEDVAVGTPNLVPDAKRPRLDSSAAATPSNAATPAASNGDGGDESEEDEFEDVN